MAWKRVILDHRAEHLYPPMDEAFAGPESQGMGMIGFDGRRAVVAALLAVAAGTIDADAQAVTLAGGARLYDDGGKAMVALRTEFPLPGPFVVEFAGSVADPLDAAPRSATSLLEAQLQLEVPLGSAFRPYVGGGIGAAKTYTLGAEDDEGGTVYSLGAGARVILSEQLGLVVDARLRDFGWDLEDDHTDVSVGLRYQFGRPDRPRFRGAPRN